MTTSRCLGSALIAAICAACDGQPARVRIDEDPILSARPLSSSRVLVQFDRDRDPSTRILDLATGTLDPIPWTASPASDEPAANGPPASSDPDGLLFVGDAQAFPDASLLRYVAATKTLYVLARDVAPRIGGAGLHRFAFQHPASGSGDLLLIEPQGRGLLALGARADLETDFVAAGNRVAFRSGDGLAVANLDGTGARTVGPPADRVIFSPDGAHLLFEARGLLWTEDPGGPAVPLDELGRMGKIVVSGTGDRIVYSVLSGERRGTWSLPMREVLRATRFAWVPGS